MFLLPSLHQSPGPPGSGPGMKRSVCRDNTRTVKHLRTKSAFIKIQERQK